MLKEIRIKNSSGISDEVTLNFERKGYDYRSEYIYNYKIINPAVIYGRNGTGKTSVLKTINNIIQIFSGDIQSGEYYAMSNKFVNSNETEIELRFELGDNNYNYQVHVKDKDVISYEILKLNGKLLLERSSDEIKYLAKKLSDREQQIEISKFGDPSEVSYRLSFLRYMGINDMNDHVTEVYDYFKTFRFVATNKNISQIGESLTKGKLLEKYNDKYDVILQDLPHIMKLQFKVEKRSSGEEIIAVYNQKGVEYEFDYVTELSSGTKDLYEMLAMLFSLKPGSLIVIDELEKTFHPELLDVLLSKVLTTLDVQVICSSHNTHLLASLRPDQIYFTKKSEDKVSVERLSNQHPGIREIHNIEKLYLGGRIG